jgi:hypothetical protein
LEAGSFRTEISPSPSAAGADSSSDETNWLDVSPRAETAPL